MKTSFLSKISSLVILAAAVGALAPSATIYGGDVGVKGGGLEYKGPSKPLFVSKKATAPAVACVARKPEFVPTVTQDTKQKTKILMVEQHACKSCSTTITSVGAQKATRKDVVKHNCAGRTVAMNTCCASVP
jgi:hypothetical protein